MRNPRFVVLGAAKHLSYEMRFEGLFKVHKGAMPYTPKELVEKERKEAIKARAQAIQRWKECKTFRLFKAKRKKFKGEALPDPDAEQRVAWQAWAYADAEERVKGEWRAIKAARAELSRQAVELQQMIARHTAIQQADIERLRREANPKSCSPYMRGYSVAIRPEAGERYRVEAWGIDIEDLRKTLAESGIQDGQWYWGKI